MDQVEFVIYYHLKSSVEDALIKILLVLIIILQEGFEVSNIITDEATAGESVSRGCCSFLVSVKSVQNSCLINCLIK